MTALIQLIARREVGNTGCHHIEEDAAIIVVKKGDMGERGGFVGMLHGVIILHDAVHNEIGQSRLFLFYFLATSSLYSLLNRGMHSD